MNITRRKILTIIRDNLPLLLVVLLAFLSKGEASHFRVVLLVLVEVFFVLIPGKMVLNTTSFSFRNRVEYNLCAYATGYVCSTLLYAGILIVGIQQHTAIVFSIYGLISLFFISKCNHKIVIREDTTYKYLLVLTICLIIALAIGYTFYYLPNRSALFVGYRNMRGDLTYWFKNCVASTKGYPLPELSIKGLNLYWHMFSCFEVAFLHFVTGIEIYDLCFTFAYIWKILLLVGSTYVLATNMLKQYSHVLIAMFVTLFTSGVDTQTLVYYQYQTYRCSLAYEEGYAISMLGILFFYKFMDKNEEKKEIAAYILTIVLFAGALGLKASAGVILLVGMSARGIVELGRNMKSNTKYIAIFVSYIIVFVTVSKLFIIDGNALTSTTSSHHMEINPFGTLFRSGYYQPIYETIRDSFAGKYISFALTVAIYLIQSNYAISIALIGALLLLAFRGRLRVLADKDVFPLIMMILFGQMIFIFTSHPGFSQVYFIYNTFSFAIILAMLLVERIEAKERTGSNVLLLVTVLMVAISMYYNVFHWEEIYRISSEEYETNFDRQGNTGDDISYYELLGLRWARDNLPGDAVIATNKALFEGNFRTFITSDYTERQVYIEGYGSTNLPSMEMVDERKEQLSNYYDGKPNGAAVLRNNGVTHAVVFKCNQNPGIVLEGRILYDNTDIQILDIQQ